MVVPESPAGYADFLAAVKEAEAALAGGPALPSELLQGYAKELLLKKQIFHDQMAALKASALKDLAKETKVKHWQWANKDALVTLFTETDAAKVQAALDGIEHKHGVWLGKYGSKKKASPTKAPAPKPAPAKVPPKPAPAAEAPDTPAAPEPAASSVFTKKGTEFEAADAAWAEKAATPGNFTCSGKAKVGGAHSKEFWTDESGDRSLFSRPNAPPTTSSPMARRPPIGSAGSSTPTPSRFALSA